VVTEALDGQPEAVHTLLARFPGRARVNLRREAVQVTARCNPGAIMAHRETERRRLGLGVRGRPAAGTGGRK
jgi:hypothetical protein